MKQELKDRFEAAKKRAADSAARVAQLTEKRGATASQTVTGNDPASVSASADLMRRVEVVERSLRDETLRGAPTMTTADFSAKSFRPTGAGSHELGIDPKRFSIVKALLARHDFDRLGTKAWETNRAEYERDALQEYYKAYSAEVGKTMTFGDESTGGFLVPPEVRAPIETLRTATWMDKLPITRISGLVGSPVLIPRQTSDNTSYWVSEGTTTTASDPAFDHIALNKRVLANATQISLSLMRSAPAVAETMARNSIAASMQRKFELGVIEGASGGPLGLKNVTGIGSVDFSSGTYNTGDGKQVGINQLILELTQDNVSVDGGAFLMSEKLWSNLYNMLLTHSTFTTTANRAASGKLPTFAWVDPQGQKWLAGYKVVTTNNLTVSTTGELYFGQWSNLIVGDWGAAEMRLETGGKTLALARQALIATFQEVDMNVMHPEAFSKGTSFTVALT